MATLCGITIVKRFAYRDIAQEEFSNQYWFKGSPPSSTALWDQLRTDVVNREMNVFPPTVEFVRVYGYDDDASDANHVYAHDYTVPGPPPVGAHVATSHPMAGDQAALVQWKTDHLNKRGKPIYLRKYLHAGFVNPSNPDGLEGGYYSAILNYGDAMLSIHGGLTNPTSARWPGGSHTVQVQATQGYVTTRTLRRRGPRPKTGT